MASAAFSTGFRTDPDPIGARVSAVAGAGAGAPPRGKTYHNMHLPQVGTYPTHPSTHVLCAPFFPLAGPLTCSVCGRQDAGTARGASDNWNPIMANARYPSTSDKQAGRWASTTRTTYTWKPKPAVSSRVFNK